jgi:hypothetical protein
MVTEWSTNRKKMVCRQERKYLVALLEPAVSVALLVMVCNIRGLFKVVGVCDLSDDLKYPASNLLYYFILTRWPLLRATACI